MIARRFSFPMIRSPDCGYSSTKSSASSRSCASQSLAAMACMYCSAILRLSVAIALSSPGAATKARAAFAQPTPDARKWTLGANVLIEPEEVVGVVRPLKRSEPLVFLVAVDPSHHVVALLDDVVHVVASGRIRLQGSHCRAAPRDVLVVLLLPGPEHLGAHPVRGAATGESHSVFCYLGDRSALSPEADRAFSGRDRDLLRRSVDSGVREVVQERALHVEALSPGHLLVAHLLEGEIRRRDGRRGQRVDLTPKRTEVMVGIFWIAEVRRADGD